MSERKERLGRRQSILALDEQGPPRPDHGAQKGVPVVRGELVAELLLQAR